MDVSKKPPCNDKKMVVKIGSAGGVGTVILFGGALATAALASAFVVGLKKRRSSGAKKSEANDQEVHEFVFVDEVSSTEVSKEVESESALLGDAQSLELDEKTDIENGGNGVEQTGDGEMEGMDHEEAVEVTEAGNRIEENVEECCNQEESGLVAVDKTHDEIHNDKMEAEKNSERKTEVESQLNGETEEVKIEGVENTTLDLVANIETDQNEGETPEMDDGDVERVNVDPMEVERNPSKEVNYDGEEPPVTESPIMEHRNTDNDVKDGVLPTDMVDMSDEVISENQEITKNNDFTGVIEEHAEEVVQENGVTEGVREDEDKYVVEEELLEEEQKEIDQFNEEISYEMTEQVNEELSNNEHEKSEEMDEEKLKNENEAENQELGDCERNVENLPILEKEMNSLESIECEANEEVPENNLLETSGKEVEDLSKTVDIDAEETTVNEADLSATTDTDTEKTSIDLIMETNEIEKGETEIIVDYDEMDLSDEVEESSVGTGESSTDSNSEAVWPAEESLETQQVNLINQEIEGKALEDKKPEAGNDFHDREVRLENESQRASIMDYSISRNTVKKYFFEFSMVKDRPENAVKKGLLIVILSVFSSYSCSWLFGCSFVKLSLIMFFSFVLSKIQGY